MSAERGVIERSPGSGKIAVRVAGLGVLVLATLPLWADASWMRAFIDFACFVVLAQMWNLMAGYGGVVSIGQQAYLGLGGYALLVMADRLGINPFLCIALSGLVSAAIAWPTAKIAFRLSGGYFAIGTWVIAEVYRLLISNTVSLGGGSGKSLTAVLSVSRTTREAATYWIALAAVSGTTALVYLLLRSPHGLALRSIRDSERASESQGIDVHGTKIWVYIAAAGGCGLAGALYFLNAVRISPDAAFSPIWTAHVIFIVVIGGIGTIEGPIVGTLIYLTLRWAMADYGGAYLMVFGALAIVVTMKSPSGVWGFVEERTGCRLFTVQRRVNVM